MGDQTENRQATEGGMRHALSTHLLVNHRLNTVSLERIQELGVPAVEILCARQHFDYTNEAQVNELAYWFRDSPLELHSLHSPMYNDDCWGRTGPGSVVTITELSKPKRLACVDEIKRALEVAEKIPCRYLIQHLGVSGEEYDERKLDAAFSALEDLMLFARHRGVQILLENIPNRLSTPERLLQFLEITHLDLGFCLDTGHANLDSGFEASFALMKDRIRSTHVHDNDGHEDRHLAPMLTGSGTIDWKQAMAALRSRPDQFPLLLEIREVPGPAGPLAMAREVFEKLEAL
jgi:sugar phosphate isomerase/epimerase